MCGYRGRAAPGASLEGGLGKGECPRAAAATGRVAAGELAASLDTRPLGAPRRRAPGSVGAEQKRESLRTAGRRDGPGPLPWSLLLAKSRVMGNTPIAKKGSEVESGESSRRPGLGSHRMGRGAAPRGEVPQGREAPARPRWGRR